MDESLKKQAYQIGLKLKHQGMDSETIYARLEKSGIPDDLAKQVVENLMIEKQREIQEKKKEKFNKGIVYIIIGVFAGLISYIIFPGMIVIPVGLISTGILLAIISKRK